MDLERALNFIRKKEGSIRMAAKLFKIPKTSLIFKLKNPDSNFGSGLIPILSETVEMDLVDFIIELSNHGFPQKKEDIKTCVQDYYKRLPYPIPKNPFINNRPGDSWYFKFLQRHRNALKDVDDFEDSDSKDETEMWFKKIGDHIMLENLSDVIEDRNRVFMIDETIFDLCSKTGNIFIERAGNSELKKATEKISVIFSFAANGSYCNPMIVYPYKKVPDDVAEGIPVGWSFGRNETGLMTSQILYEYITNVFSTKLKEDKIEFPVILFVDGYKTHVTLEVFELCKSLQIHLIAIYRKYTRILSPSDLAFLRPVKTAWKRGLRDWYAEKSAAKKSAAAVNMLTFAPFLQSILDFHIDVDDLTHGFRVSGLHPFRNIIEFNDVKSLTDTRSNIENDNDKENCYLYYDSD